MKKTVTQFAILLTLGCFGIPTAVAQLPKISNPLSEIEISRGLKEALNKGINKQILLLAAKDGFLKNETVKITLPAELKKVEKQLRQMGMGNLADQGLELLNRAAEDAVKEATPIFIDAVKEMTFTDAKNILLGNESAATTYLQTNTSSSLYAKFNPIIKKSFSKVGADKVWKEIISQYNRIPFVKKVTPDLTDYTTRKTIEGVFKMMALEEKEIRTNLAARNTSTLKKVFELQDKLKL
jgi:endo-1,4-beta-D-glucanase Y